MEGLPCYTPQNTRNTATDAPHHPVLSPFEKPTDQTLLERSLTHKLESPTLDNLAKQPVGVLEGVRPVVGFNRPDAVFEKNRTEIPQSGTASTVEHADVR